MSDSNGTRRKAVSQRTAESLGAVRKELSPNRTQQFAEMIFGSLLVVGGSIVLYCVWQTLVDKRVPPPEAVVTKWATIVLGPVLGLGLLGSGLLLGYFGWRHLSFRLFVCDEGFYYINGLDIGVFAWDELAAITETTADEGSRASQTYSVHRWDGEEFIFSKTTVQSPVLLAAPLASAALRWGVLWVKDGAEVFPGGMVPETLHSMLYFLGTVLYRNIQKSVKEIAPKEPVQRIGLFYYDTTNVGDPWLIPFIVVGTKSQELLDSPIVHLNEEFRLPDPYGGAVCEPCGDDDLGKVVNAIYVTLSDLADERELDGDDDVMLKPFREVLHRTAIRLNRRDWHDVLNPAAGFSILVSDTTGYWTQEDAAASLPRQHVK